MRLITPIRALALAAVVAAAVGVSGGRSAEPSLIAGVGRHDEAGRAARPGERGPRSHRPTIEAAFGAESYAPGVTAKLLLFDSARDVTLRLFRVGDARGALLERDVMRGNPVTGARRLGEVSSGQSVMVRLGSKWRSGLYFARLTTPPDRVGYAPFVLAPRRLGKHQIAVVLPTQTWQAYNFRDDDGNGTPDSWYGSATSRVRLIRPFENRGVPGHYRKYDEPFLRWLERSRYAVDYLSDRELRRTTGAELARAYDLVIFESHHEYVTESEYDAVAGYRDRGGNLMFLSGNNFFRKVTISGRVMKLVGRWRNLGRPESALVGVQWFLGCAAPGTKARPWTVRETAAGRWIFRGTGLRPGSTLSWGGIEADSVAAASPPGTQIVAVIRDVFGTGKDAHMTFYESPSGAKVFAAGAFTLAGAVWQPSVSRTVANLIEALSRGDEGGQDRPVGG